mmetsp:Transcript_25708/g.73442  ORF Transcript_25708/g.73442 Transcript_25708/m.73442 type:complete len:327 (+) Transcript_25708:648-1628(+)
MEGVHGGRFSTDHSVNRGVGGGEPQAWALPLLHGGQLLLGPLRHGEHRSRLRQGLRRLRTGGHDGDGRLQAEQPPRDGGGVLAKGMPRHGSRFHPDGVVHLRQGVLHGEETRLEDRRFRELRLGGAGRQQGLPRVEAQIFGVAEELAAPVQHGLKQRHLLVQAPRHAQVLAALPWEDKGHRWLLRRLLLFLQLLLRRKVVVIELRQCSGHPVRDLCDHQRLAQGELRAANLQGVRRVPQRPGLAAEGAGDHRSAAAERAYRLGRHGQHVVAPLRPRVRLLRRRLRDLLKHAVGVGAPDAEGADACAQGAAPPVPTAGFVVHEHRRA